MRFQAYSATSSNCAASKKCERLAEGDSRIALRNSSAWRKERSAHSPGSSAARRGCGVESGCAFGREMDLLRTHVNVLAIVICRM